MDIRVLKYFVTVADEKGVTSAAKVLNITQPPLSNAIRVLEEEVGFPLFYRSGKTFSLTPEGRLLYQHARKMIADFDSINSMFADMKSESSYTLRIGTSRLPGLCLLPAVTERMMRANSHIHFSITEGKSWDLVKLMNEGELDFAFIQKPFDTEQFYSLNVESYFSSAAGMASMTLVGRHEFFEGYEDTVCIRDLKDFPLIVHNYQKEIILEMCMKQGVRPRIVCTNTSLFSSLIWAEYGLGAAIMLTNTTTSLADFFKSDRLVSKPIRDMDYIPPVHNLIWRRDTPLNSFGKKFVSEVTNALEEQKK